MAREESEATDIEQAMTDSGLRIARYTSYDIVIYPSVAPAGITTEEGRQQDHHRVVRRW